MSTEYKVYVDDTFRLAQSMVIKSNHIANSFNRKLSDLGIESYFDDVNKPTWKYYLNLNGQYHSTDPIIKITSLDTLEEIEFTKENLNLHKATYKAYITESNYFRDLIVLHPDQKVLIRGILNPVDIDTAINAVDGEILSYNKTLVEPQETTLITRLQNWINIYYIRWVNTQYNISDEYYPYVYLGIMYSNLIPALMILRKEMCKTNEAHTYHIKQYLLSHGIPEFSIRKLTLEQKLYFYRNIKYINKHAGMQTTFTDLTTNVLTKRVIPLAEYNMVHNLEAMPEELTPQVLFKKNNLNLIQDYENRDVLTVDELLKKEENIAVYNPMYREMYSSLTNRTLQLSLSDQLKTKVLESSLIDYTNANEIKLEEVLLNHWVYLATLNKYTAFMRVDHPKTNKKINLSAKDSFILLTYLFSRKNGIVLEYIPDIVATLVQRIPIPDTNDLLSIVDDKRNLKSLANNMLSLNPALTSYISIESFNAVCTQIYTSLRTQKMMCSDVENFIDRGYAVGMMYRIYCDKLCALAPPNTKYEDWLIEKDIDFTDFTIYDYELLFNILLNQGTGLDLTEDKSLKALQEAMLKLMLKLSSYSIQLLHELNMGDLLDLGNTGVSLGDDINTSNTHVLADSLGVELFNFKNLDKEYVNLLLNYGDLNNNIRITSNELIEIKSQIDLLPTSISDKQYIRIMDTASELINFEIS